MKIFTDSDAAFQFADPDKSAFPELSGPVLFLLRTDTCSSHDWATAQKGLSDQELQKASRFRFQRDQQSYILTHAMLRIILGNFLESKPSEIEFITNEFGKPFLSEKHRKIHFNLSHSSGISALAFSIHSEIGVDVEKIDPEFDFNLIAKAHFSRAENVYLKKKEDEACKQFYTLWTRKEALLKLIGTGIGEHLGIEVFRNVNPGLANIQVSDLYLNSFLFENEYIVSATACTPHAYWLVYKYF